MVRKGATEQQSATPQQATTTTVQGVQKQKQAPPAKKISRKFYVDCSAPVEDGIFDLEHFEAYVAAKFKIDGKAGKMSGKVRLFKSKNKLCFKSDNHHYTKRYVKYLTKKYLKKQELRDWLHVVSTNNASDKKGYALKYFNISQGAEQQNETAAE